MNIPKCRIRRLRQGLVLVSCLPVLAHAEPAPSMRHLPFLWALVVIVGVLAAALTLLLTRWLAPQRSKRFHWGLAIFLGVLAMLFTGPIIIAFGSILITGRTM